MIGEIVFLRYHNLHRASLPTRYLIISLITFILRFLIGWQISENVLAVSSVGSGSRIDIWLVWSPS